MKLPAMPNFITTRATQASEFVKKHISGKLPAIPATSRTTKAGIGAVAVLAVGTAAFIRFSDKQSRANLWERCTKTAKATRTAIVKFAQEHPTAVRIAFVTAVVLSGSALAYRLTSKTAQPVPPQVPPANSVPPQVPPANSTPQVLFPKSLENQAAETEPALRFTHNNTNGNQTSLRLDALGIDCNGNPVTLLSSETLNVATTNLSTSTTKPVGDSTTDLDNNIVRGSN